MDKTKDEIEVDRLEIEVNIEKKYPSLRVEIPTNTASKVTFLLRGGDEAKADLLGDFYDNPTFNVLEVGPTDDGSLRVVVDNLINE